MDVHWEGPSHQIAYWLGVYPGLVDRRTIGGAAPRRYSMPRQRPTIATPCFGLIRCAGLLGTLHASSAITPEEGSAACSIRGAKEAPQYKECNLRPVLTKRLCDALTDELDCFPKRAGFPGVKHAPVLSEASDFPISHPLERHLTCALKT